MDRLCKMWLEINNGARAMYSLAPIKPEELGPEFVAGFHLRKLAQAEEARPVYLVRMLLDGSITCNCPSSYWAAQKREENKECKHAAALKATGVFSAPLVELIQSHSRLLDAAEQRIEQLTKFREMDREAACRNVDSLRKTITQLEGQLHDVRQHALQLQTALDAVHASPKRRPRSVKAA